MTDLATVVALLTLGAITRHVAVTTARVASLSTTTLATVRGGTTTVTALATVGSTAVGAVASDMANLATLVAFGSSGRATERATTLLGVGVVALTGQVANFTALVARLLLRSLLAFTAQMTILSAVVANGVTALGTLASLMTALTTVVASTAANGTATVEVRRSVRVHYFVWCEGFQVAKLDRF